MPIIYSSAFNELGEVAGEPDPCTGIFSKKITLGKIKGNFGLGPEFSLDLQFNPLNTIDVSNPNAALFGYGWGLDLPGYIFDSYSSTGQLSLLGGQTYIMRNAYTGAQPTLDGYTLQDIKISVPTSSTIDVLYASGERLCYSRPDNDAQIVSITSRSGRSLFFSYYAAGGIIQLLSITDDTNNKLVNFSYDQSSVIVNFFPSQPDSDSYTVKLDIQQSFLDRVSYSNDLYTANFEYVAQTAGNPVWYISRFSDSNGLVETVEYDNYIFLPDGAPLNSMFVPSQYTSSAGTGLPTSTCNYEFGISNASTKSLADNNYMGYGSGISFANNVDTLSEYIGEYYYTNRVTRKIDDQSPVVETYTYDKFHSQIKLTTTQDNSAHLKTESVTYYADETLGASNQSPIYTRPKEKTTR